ncbi:hypothetical protein DAPPUDRAFT_325260 [Daphnia pulex]|uniref:Uncharacterized protein n=1 Tax=Daphnia pulex TaxID=6669 RepID=E9H472_DAPPU|nr:hypothetical protein DAPPUDRAFT_325260 [Daphnia pulex]|eukprot:EFX73464.1 hypothetical protein DAPPUDRAFT_325260 [Daphnia pulex]
MICFSFIVVVPDTYCTEAGFKSLVNIWKLAHRYGHHALFLHCLSRIKPHIAVDNVLFLYRWSVKCGLPLLRLALAKVEMRELLESKDNQQKALKQKNEILQDLVITLKIDDQNQMQFLYDLFVKAGTTAKPRTITVKRAPTTARSLGDNIPV